MIGGARQQSGTGKEVSMATVLAAKGTVTLNRSVEYLMNLILTKGRAERKKAWKLSRLNDLTHSQASK